MPNYELQCTVCSKRYTIRSSINQPLNAINCPECVIPLKRVYTAPGITFKGDGWGKD